MTSSPVQPVAPRADDPPRFGLEDARRIARDCYALECEMSPLPGERDQNFLARTADGDSFVLKIAHAAEEVAVLDFQNRALEHAARHVSALAVPKVVPTTEQQELATVSCASGGVHLVRLVTWLPGTPLVEVRPHSPELLRELGTRLAALDTALLDFSHPAMDRHLKWDLQHGVPFVGAHLGVIDDARRQRMVKRLHDRFESEIVDRLPTLRRSVIHSDANDHNVLVRLDGTRQTIGGLIDFGDMVRSCTIGELAIAAMYAMLGKTDPMAAASSIVEGYHRGYPLEDDEIEVLFDLIRLRLCVSVCNAAHEKKRQPDHEYLLVTEAPAWRLLEQLEDVHPRFAQNRFRDACGLVPCPRNARIVEWLKTHQAETGPLIQFKAGEPSTDCIDLSVASPDVTFPPDPGNARLARDIELARARTGAEVLVGRYAESRLLYRDDEFRRETEDGPEWRSIHLGMDFFADEQTPVLAPLDGVVHSVHDNAGHLDYGPTVVLRHTSAENVEFFTLYGHMSRASIARLQTGQAVSQGDVLATVGGRGENGGWPPHLHFQVITDLLGHTESFPGVAPPSEQRVWLSLCPNPDLIVSPPNHHAPVRSSDRADIQSLRRAHLGPSLSVAYDRPLVIVRAHGQHLFDEHGQPFLDCVNNVCHVGHAHPRVVDAAARQMGVLNTNTRYLHEHLGRYAERLSSTLPEGLDVCFFVCSGSEANELALRLAQAHTGGQDVIALAAGYHGNTQALIDVSSYKCDGPGGSGPPDHVHIVELPDVYRGRFRTGDTNPGLRYAELVGEAIDEIAKRDRQLSAFIAEAAPGCGGQIFLPPGYLTEAYRLARLAGGVCVADEVQTGLGRMGIHFWAFELQGVVPDIVTLGKPIGNGHPLAAVVTTRDIAESFDNGMEYFNTFGGNPVSCAVGLTVLDVIEDERLQAHAESVGRRFLERLDDLKSRHDLIGDVRGHGLYLGIELVRDRKSLEPATWEAAHVINRMRDKGVLLSTDGPHHNVLKIKPPLVFSTANVETFCLALDQILRESVLMQGSSVAAGGS